MKKPLLVLCVLFISVSVWAQAGEAGEWYLGMNLIAGDTMGEGMFFAPTGIAIGGRKTYSGNTVTSDLFTANLNVLAEGGYFVMDGLEIGPVIAYRFWDWHDNEDDSNYGREAVLAPGLQAMYIFRLSGNVLPYVQAGGAFVWMSKKYDNKDYYGYKFMPAGGVKIAVAKAFLDLGLFYSFVSMSLDGSSPVEKTELSSGGLRIGLNLIL